MRLISRAAMLGLTVMMLPPPVHGQWYEPSEAAGGPLSGVVLNAPFSAKAVTKVKESLANGAVREQTVTSSYYRDSRGHVRAELDNPWGQYVVLWLPGPERGVLYSLDPGKRTYRITGQFFAKALFNGEGRVALPLAKVCFRVAPAVAGASDGERLAAVNAQMSPDLGVVIASHRSDDIASIDYELTNIRREEPAADLFEVPSDYVPVTGSVPDDPMIAFSPWHSRSSCLARTR